MPVCEAQWPDNPENSLTGEDPLENVDCVKAWWSLTLIPAHSSLTLVINFHFLSWCVPAMGCTKWTQLLLF